jgi:hypothetical protein
MDVLLVFLALRVVLLKMPRRGLPASLAHQYFSNFAISVHI